MPISSDQAADALGEVRRTARRTSVLRGYSFAAPHFWLWGVVWLLGYAFSWWRPAAAGSFWTALDLVGFAGSALLARSASRRAARPAAQGVGRVMAMAATGVGFVVATYVILAPHSGLQFAAFPPLVVAAIYTGVGIWQGLRWSIIGVVLAALTVGGYLLWPDYFLPWMALAGGGALLLTGWWLRHA